MQQSFL